MLTPSKGTLVFPRSPQIYCAARACRRDGGPPADEDEMASLGAALGSGPLIVTGRPRGRPGEPPDGPGPAGRAGEKSPAKERG